jgi:hypothetical protein
METLRLERTNAAISAMNDRVFILLNFRRIIPRVKTTIPRFFPHAGGGNHFRP